ncbi:MAG: type II secretion system F family protein [Clostridia bacterium]|nr:type II secretion system F family protein [Clostridia bacterium]
MAVFNYRAIGANGESVSGKLNAKDRAEVLGMLREKSWRPISVEQKREVQEISFAALSGKIGTKDVAVFCRQFYTMLNSGISIIQCLDILRQQFDNKKMRAIISEVYELVQKGASLSDSMRQYKNAFPELLINMVDAGEASGNLDTILGRMAEHYEKDTRLRRKVVGAMIYPAVLMSVTVLVVIFLLTFVLPTFIQMFESSGVELPFMTRMLLGLSGFIRTFWYLVLGGLILLIWWIRHMTKTDRGMYFFDSLKLKLPIISPVMIRIATTRFTRTLSTLLVSGIPLMNGMEITSKVIGNKVIEKTILSVREDIRKGYDLAGPIKRSKQFPPMVDSMIKIGEESGSLDDALRRTADFYDEEVDAAIQRMTTMLEPLLIVFMALVVGSIIIAIIQPMFGMYEMIG